MTGVEIPTGYTPGPWRYRDEDRLIVTGQPGGGLLDTFHIAKVCSQAEETEANARLIALAPEMAAELQRLRAALDVDHLSNIIRRVDGSNSLGAGVLAEKIVEAIKREIGA